MKGIHEFLLPLRVEAGKSSRSGSSESEEERMPGALTYHRPRSAYSITLGMDSAYPNVLFLWNCLIFCTTYLLHNGSQLSGKKLFEAVRTKANPGKSQFLHCFNLGNLLLKELVENYWKEWKHLYSFALQNGRSTYPSFPGFYTNVFQRGFREHWGDSPAFSCPCNQCSATASC